MVRIDDCGTPFSGFWNANRLGCSGEQSAKLLLLSGPAIGTAGIDPAGHGKESVPVVPPFKPLQAAPLSVELIHPCVIHEVRSFLFASTD